MSTPVPIDPERFKVYVNRVFGALSGAMTSAMIYLGDRMGLYRSLAEAGAATSAELAARTGLQERWLREWLHQQGAAGVLDYLGEGRFQLSPEGIALLADENHPANGVGFFSQLPQLIGITERLPESFRTGLGLPYDAMGPEGARGVERGLAPWFRALLVPLALPRVAGVVAMLEAGIDVADVGCGAGTALLTMAKAYPELALPRLRHLAARTRARRSQPQGSGTRQREVPRRADRPAPRGRPLRLRHHLRLPARHDRSRRRDPLDPPLAPRRRHLVRRRHQGDAERTSRTSRRTRWPR